MKRLIKFIYWINVMVALSACHSMSGNVVPQNAPTMERVYDSMREEDAGVGRKQLATSVQRLPHKKFSEDNAHDNLNGFHKLKNPLLKVMVLPHLSGDEEVPIPLYSTYISAYDKDYYAMPYEN